jgi:hypothetical protein
VVNEMKTYARIEAGAVTELLRTEVEPVKLFHPALRWVAVTNPAVAIGWIESGDTLVPPPVPPVVVEPPAEPVPTLTQLHARITELAAQVAALTH